MTDRRPENPDLWVWDPRKSFHSTRHASPADLIAAARRGVESGTIKGSEWLLCGDHEGKLYTSRHLYQMNHTEYCGRYLVIPVSDGGSET